MVHGLLKHGCLSVFGLFFFVIFPSGLLRPPVSTSGRQNGRSESSVGGEIYTFHIEKRNSSSHLRRRGHRPSDRVDLETCPKGKKRYKSHNREVLGKEDWKTRRSPCNSSKTKLL
jgi:hypothetical protein